MRRDPQQRAIACLYSTACGRGAGFGRPGELIRRSRPCGKRSAPDQTSYVMAQTSLSGPAAQLTEGTQALFHNGSVFLSACTARRPTVLPSDVPTNWTSVMPSANASASDAGAAQAPSGVPVWLANSSLITAFPSSAPSASWISPRPPVPTTALASPASGVGVSLLAITLAAVIVGFVTPFGS